MTGMDKSEESLEVKKKKRRKATKANVIRYILLAIMAVIFTFSAYSLTKRFLEYGEGDQAYEEVDNMFYTTTDTGDDQGNGTAESDGKVAVSKEKKKWTWDFSKLKKLNKEAVGYIRQEDTRIQYPILQHSDNSYYLTHLYDNTYNRNGSIFLDYRLTEKFDSKNTIIYGHNMWSDAMFGTLTQYLDEKSYYKKHPTFDIYEGDDHYICYVFAMFEANAKNDPVYQYSFTSDEEFTQWIKEQRARSVYDTSKRVREITKDDKIITLSTCTKNNSSKRVVIMLLRGELIVDE